MDLLGLADDLTGALEVGAKFAAAGIEALVATGPESRRPPVLVIDLETRHLPAGEAAGRVRTAAAGAALIYKKTDSTLRGNIGAELGALIAAHPDSPLIYAPAYPAMGRAVRGGHLYIEGVPAHRTAFARDALNPIACSDIVRMLRAQTDAPVVAANAADLHRLAPGVIYVCDGESDADVEQAAAAVLAGCRLAAGPGALAESIARRMPLARAPAPRPPRLRRCLVINGSRHERSTAQVCHAVQRGWRVVGIEAALAADWTILEGNGIGMGSRIRDRLRSAKLEALIIFGGDTAYSILHALGDPPLRPLGEVVPGVPVSRVEGFDLHLISKAGGFGAVDLLPAIRSALA